MDSGKETPEDGRRENGSSLRTVILLAGLVLFFCPAVVAAPEVILSTPGNEFYFLAGEEASIPVTLSSTTGKDIPGTLKQVMIPSGPGAAGPGDASVRIRDMSAFTEARTVSVPVGRSAIPADYTLTVSFIFPDGGGRIAVLEGIAIHFVAVLEQPDSEPQPLVGTDTADPSATSPGGSSAAEGPGREDPDAALQSGQIPQDSSALKEQMLRESNRSRLKETALEEYILSDPLIVPLNRSLAGAGYTLGETDIIPQSEVSGSFVLSYRSEPGNAVVRGYVQDTRVLFAELSSESQVPLPKALLDNGTYREYESRVSGIGFLPGRRLINHTPGRETVDLAYSGVGTRILHLRAEVVNGTVAAITGDDPEDLLSLVPQYLPLVVVLLLSGGIWFLARRRPPADPGAGVCFPAREQKDDPRGVAGRLLDTAEEDAKHGDYPEAYRKTGRALRIVLSDDEGTGDEMTSDEMESLLGSSPDRDDRIRFVLDRSRAVGFAKDTTDEGELLEMIRVTRSFLKDSILRNGEREDAPK